MTRALALVRGFYRGDGVPRVLMEKSDERKGSWTRWDCGRCGAWSWIDDDDRRPVKHCAFCLLDTGDGRAGDPVPVLVKGSQR